MAKRNKPDTAGGQGRQINSMVLFVGASALLTAGWLMRSFPVFIFVGLAPLFAITDKTSEGDKFWEYTELILIALAIAFLAAHLFDFSALIGVLIQSIVLTLSFAGYTFCRQALGPRVGKFTIILFWLGFEYVFLKTNQADRVIFLADATQLKADWLKWTSFSGYLSATAWILFCNLLFYNAVLKKDKINWVMLALFLIGLGGPVVYSLTAGSHAVVSRQEMAALYAGLDTGNSVYQKRGEFIPRTAAWISVLIFTFALIKNKTEKR